LTPGSILIQFYLENRFAGESVFMPCGDAGAMGNCVHDECIGRAGIKPAPWMLAMTAGARVLGPWAALPRIPPCVSRHGAMSLCFASSQQQTARHPPHSHLIRCVRLIQNQKALNLCSLSLPPGTAGAVPDGKTAWKGNRSVGGYFVTGSSQKLVGEVPGP